MGGPTCGGGAATTSLAARTGGPLERQSCVQGAPALGGPAGMRWHEFSDNPLCANSGTTAALIAGGLRAGAPGGRGGPGEWRRILSQRCVLVLVLPLAACFAGGACCRGLAPPPHPLPSRVPCGLSFCVRACRTNSFVRRPAGLWPAGALGPYALPCSIAGPRAGVLQCLVFSASPQSFLGCLTLSAPLCWAPSENRLCVRAGVPRPLACPSAACCGP